MTGMTSAAGQIERLSENLSTASQTLSRKSGDLRDRVERLLSDFRAA
jgi:hypothetical protein